MSVPLMRCAIRVRCVSDVQLINFPQTWGEQRTPGASSSLCVSVKNWQILVCGERYANVRRWQIRSSVHTYVHLVRKRFVKLSSYLCIQGFIQVKILKNAEFMTSLLFFSGSMLSHSSAYFQIDKSLVSYSSTPGGDKDMRPLSFL